MPVIAAIALATAALGSQVIQGQKAAKEQKRALVRQEVAQARAASAAVSQRRRAEQDFAAANRKQPDASSILAAQQADAATGAASTMLTGPSGVKPAGAGKRSTSLLGEPSL